MGPLLLILALLAGGTAYYEFNWQQQSGQGFQSQIQNWESQLARLKTENKELTALKASLSQQAESARASFFQPANNAAMPGQSTAPPTLPPGMGGIIEDLGTFTTVTGKTYQDSKVLKIEATDIIISCTDGITQVAYAIMPPDLQKKFGWDPQKSSVINAATIRYQEQLEAAKEAAAADGANLAPSTAPPNPNMVPGMAPAPGTTNP
jgi:hypothetical protein